MIRKNTCSQLKSHVITAGRYSFPTNWVSREVEVNVGGIQKCLDYSETLNSFNCYGQKLEWDIPGISLGHGSFV